MALRKLPRLPTNQQIVDDKGYPTTVFVLWWNEFATAIETNFGGIEAALAAAGIALDAADVAIAAADAAQAATDASIEATALANSYVSGITVTATDVGADVTIAISAHTRNYAYDPPTSVAVNAGNVTGQPYDTQIYVYYVQASRAGGAVTYLATTDVTDVAQVGDTHSVATVLTPAAAAPPNNGGGSLPPGGNFNPLP